MKIDINLVKQLRTSTMASLVECKKALEEAQGDLDKAMKILREKGALKAAKKADRETNEGAVISKKINNTIVGITLYCETDFVAKNEKFISLVNELADHLGSSQEASSFGEVSIDVQNIINAKIKENILTLGENLQLGPVFVRESDGYVYNHNGNKISAIIFGKGEEETLKEVALQITAMNPQYLSRNNVPTETIDELNASAEKSLEGDNKPQDIKEKIVAGKVSKALEEFVLLEQIYIRDGSKKIKDIIGDNVITDFIRMSV